MMVRITTVQETDVRVTGVVYSILLAIPDLPSSRTHFRDQPRDLTYAYLALN